MRIEQFQVNTKFLNTLPPEWGKFMTDVKLVKDLYTTNFDQLHADLEQHELYANEVRLLRERNQDPLAFVANQQMTPPHFNTYESRVFDGQPAQTIIPNNAAFQTEDLDMYDSDCDDISNAQAVLMANISNYGSGVILEEAQQIKPTLYDGIVISAKHIAMHVIDDEETLILEKESRSKKAKKDKDPEAIKQKISNNPVDYVKLNMLHEDFGKRFVPQHELLVDETLWYHMLNLSTKSSDALPIKIEAAKEPPRIKRKEIVDIAAQKPSANTITPRMFNLDLETLAPRLLQNREIHLEYLKNTEEQVHILWGIVEQAKAKQPLEDALNFACKHAQQIQEFLVYVQDTCPNVIKPSAKKVDVTPKNKVKKVTFAELLALKY
uniref:Integrase, catalytic region, zinc finger, CCHC-type, peptidase aspartic, catalytic n=1 Tax=Tanacetum cinerariifolium TaxID=118510 RepID=A0A699H325_TANCI|nr:hypothetical protein [Tanacetum cinerariifolium]